MVIAIKKRIILLSLILGILSGLMKIQAQDIPLQNMDPYSLEAYVKIKSIKKASQDALQIYREIGAEPKQIAACYIFLSLLGYPNYFSIAQDQNVCVFIYRSSQTAKRKYVFLTQLLEGNNVTKIIENLGASREDYQGWTFFAKRKEDFNLIKDKAWMIQYAKQQTNNDIEFNIQPTLFSLINLGDDKKLTDTLKNINEIKGLININDTQIVINGILNYENPIPAINDWLIKNLSQGGITTKIFPKSKKESEIYITLERNNLRNLIHELRAKISLFNQTE